MTRKEFPTRIRVAVIKRATANNVVYCEACRGIAKKFQIDHINPDGLTGQPTIENAQLLCEGCYAVKNPQDTTAIAKAKRREAARIGANPPPRVKIAQRPKAAPRHAPRESLPPKQLYRG